MKDITKGDKLICLFGKRRGVKTILVQEVIYYDKTLNIEAFEVNFLIKAKVEGGLTTIDQFTGELYKINPILTFSEFQVNPVTDLNINYRYYNTFSPGAIFTSEEEFTKWKQNLIDMYSPIYRWLDGVTPENIGGDIYRLYSN